jgi:hypothetical protein
MIPESETTLLHQVAASAWGAAREGDLPAARRGFEEAEQRARAFVTQGVAWAQQLVALYGHARNELESFYQAEA